MFRIINVKASGSHRHLPRDPPHPKNVAKKLFAECQLRLIPEMAVTLVSEKKDFVLQVRLALQGHEYYYYETVVSLILWTIKLQPTVEFLTKRKVSDLQNFSLCSVLRD